MMTKIAYVDGRPDLIKTEMLDALISKGKLKMFHRAGGWAIVGRDKLRGADGTYKGQKRRLMDDKNCECKKIEEV
ncbi:MAG: hypothetical protein HZC48_11505 [Nitrospirae bacterium]|nr:hypothetical protein [Nitrospirota bacterium]